MESAGGLVEALEDFSLFVVGGRGSRGASGGHKKTSGQGRKRDRDKHGRSRDEIGSKTHEYPHWIRRLNTAEEAEKSTKGAQNQRCAQTLHTG
jgi:hypothetical protein